MPSRPMFTTPARSQTRPPEPGQRDREGEGQHGLRGAGVGQDVLAGDEPGDGQRDQAERGDEADPAPERRGAARVLRRPGGGRDLGAHAGTSAVWAAGRRRGRPGSATDPALLGPLQHAPGDLVDDDDRQDDHSLGDDDDRRGDVDPLQRGSGPVEEGEQQRRDGDPAGRVAAEQGDGDAREAESGHEVDAVRVVLPQHLRHPDEPGQRPRQQHGLHRHPTGRYAARGRGGRRCAPTRAARNRSGSGSSRPRR